MDFTTSQQEKSGVQLTKFNVVSERTDASENYNFQHEDENCTTKTMSATDPITTEQHQRPQLGEKTESNNLSQTFEADRTSQAESQTNHGHRESSSSATFEPFQVVWRRLSFEVNVSTYDKLIKKTLNDAKAFWCCGKQTGAQKKFSISESTASLDDSLGFNSQGGKRIIFKNLNGHFNSGEITAILGPSGSGKTSLLNAIAGQVNGYRGSLKLNGGGERRMRLSIIPQKDYLMENLTVRENLLFASKILNSDKNFDHEANILRVVKMLNLSHCVDSTASKISGGEYKRVSIAQELLRQPDILILDEPTSGLDSLNCKHLIQSLAKLIEESRKGTINPIAIVMTIHQPDVDIFQMFDHMYCMARGGRVIFDGHPSEAMAVIRQQSGLSESQLPTQEGQVSVNPANLLIEIASEFLYGQVPLDRLSRYQLEKIDRMGQSIKHPIGGGEPVLPTLSTSPAESNPSNQSPSKDDFVGQKGSSRKLFASHPNTHSSVSNISACSFLSMDSSLSAVGNQANDKKQIQLVRDKRLAAKMNHSSQFMRQTKLIVQREFTSVTRDPMTTIVSLLFHLMIPFAMWMVYSPKIGSIHACPILQREMDIVSMLSNKTLTVLMERQSEITYVFECSTMFFLSIYSFSLCATAVAALAFPLNMHILLKEVRNGWYSLPCNVLAKTIASFPCEVLFPVFSVVVVYLLLDMPESYLGWRVWAIALVTALVAMISHTQGLVFGALCMDSAQTAVFLAAAATLPQMMISGFTARIYHMPKLLQTLSWFSLYRYSSQSVNIIRYGFGICPCDSTTDEYLRTQPPTFDDIPDSINSLFAYYLTSINDNATSSANVLDINSNLIPGVGQDLSVDASERNELLASLAAKQLDFPTRMANLISRSFAYGRQVSGCESVRSLVLIEIDSPPDSHLSVLFVGMLALLLAYKITLFVVVKYKIGSRI